jgi:hypothetical protein
MKEFFMPFGSLANSYGLVNYGKAIPTEKFIEDMRKIKEFAVEITEDKRAGTPLAQDIEL